VGFLLLSGKQREGPWGIRLGNEGFQTVQQIEPSQQRDEIAQGDGARLFEPLERRQTDTALMSEVNLGHGRALRRNSPSPNGMSEALGYFSIGEMI
jgi:hypothetical protein